MSTTPETPVEILIQKIALELAFAQPGKDEGLLPVNNLLGQIEELAGEEHGPEAFRQSLAEVRSQVDAALLAGGFDGATLGHLTAWTNWAQRVWLAVRGGIPVPQFPGLTGGETVAWPTEAATPTPAGAAALSGEERTAARSEPPRESVSVPATVEGGKEADRGTLEYLELNLAADGDLLREFVDESKDHLSQVEQGLLVLEQNPTDAETLNAIFRAFHSFKGGSGFLNLIPINRLTHQVESLLDQARKGTLAVTSDVIDLVLSAGDVLKQCVEVMDAQVAGRVKAEPIPVAVEGLVRRVKALAEGTTAPRGSEPAGQVGTMPSGERGGEGTRSPRGDHRSPVPDAGPGTAEDRSPGLTPAGVPGAAAASGPWASGASGTGNAGGRAKAKAGRERAVGGSVKVDTAKLDSLVDLVGEMVIAQSLVTGDAELRTLQNPQLARHLAQLGRITAELQRTAMSLRMVPIHGAFQKVARLVRDLSQKSGKAVELVTSGDETELDRNLTEELDAPLVHMIRNAMDHGIERSEVRVAAGKPAWGTINLRAFHQGGNIVIEVRDDGAGLNRERILAKAIEKGLVREGQNPTEGEVFNLVFAPGFSTAEQVTEISGRGVGMDVVRRNISRLRGKIEVQSAPGRGSTFTIVVPLTLAIIEGLIVSVGGQRFIVPTLAVRESFRPAAGMVHPVHGRGEMVEVRGRLCPLLRLRDYFQVEGGQLEATEAIGVVVESNHEVRCLLVDQLLGKQEVVIKSLGEMFKQNRALAGAAILGDGRVGLILDVHTLVHLSGTPLARAA